MNIMLYTTTESMYTGTDVMVSEGQEARVEMVTAFKQTALCIIIREYCTTRAEAAFALAGSQRSRGLKIFSQRAEESNNGRKRGTQAPV